MRRSLCEMAAKKAEPSDFEQLRRFRNTTTANGIGRANDLPRDALYHKYR